MKFYSIENEKPTKSAFWSLAFGGIDGVQVMRQGKLNPWNGPSWPEGL